MHRSRDPITTRRAILEAAAKVFVAQGYAAASTAEIAQQAGVTKSLIHHHFRSKAGLWTEVLERSFAEQRKHQAEILDRPELSVADFEQSIRSYFAFLRAHPDLVRLLAWASADGSVPATRPERELMQRAVGRMRALQLAGTIRADIDPLFVLVAFFNLVEHWFQARATLEARFGEDLPDHDDYLDDLVRALLRGIQP